MIELKRIIELKNSHHWKTLKEVLDEEYNKICKVKNLHTLYELKGAQFLEKLIENIKRKVDGSEDSLGR